MATAITPPCLVRGEVVATVAGAGQTDLEYRTEWLVVVVV